MAYALICKVLERDVERWAKNGPVFLSNSQAGQGRKGRDDF